MTKLYPYRGGERTLDAIATSEGVTCLAIKSRRWSRYGRTEKAPVRCFEYNGAQLSAADIARAEGISKYHVKDLYRKHGRIRRRRNTAEDFLVQCIKLYPWETGESVVSRVMAVAPSKWSKSTLISLLSKLRSANKIVAKPYEQRTGKDKRTMVYAVANGPTTSHKGRRR